MVARVSLVRREFAARYHDDVRHRQGCEEGQGPGTSAGCVAAVYAELQAGDERGVVACQVRDSRGNLGRLSQPPHRRHVEHRLLDRRSPGLVEYRGIDKPGMHRVHPVPRGRPSAARCSWSGCGPLLGRVVGR